MANKVRYPEAFSAQDAREIRRIKARVESERLPQGADPTRHLKLGRGSLSDVEWVVQLFQLFSAHQAPELQTTSTIRALGVLSEQGYMSEEEEQTLATAWLMASQVRTALTLFGAKNTDLLPSDRQTLEGAARLMGYSPGSASVLEEEYLRQTRQARAVFERLFYEQ
jgi:glutamate-ammonia-ligase adenylyltransferase